MCFSLLFQYVMFPASVIIRSEAGKVTDDKGGIYQMDYC